MADKFQGTGFGAGTSPVDFYFHNPAGNQIFSRGLAADKPSAVAGYAVGCLYCASDTGAIYSNTGSITSATYTLLESAIGGVATALVDSNGVTALDTGATASAVNNLRVTNSATGAVSANAVTLSAVGTDSAVSLTIIPKGVTGIITLGAITQTGVINVGIATTAATAGVNILSGAGVASTQTINQQMRGQQMGLFLQSVLAEPVQMLLQQKGLVLNIEPILRKMWEDGLGQRSFGSIVSPPAVDPATGLPVGQPVPGAVPGAMPGQPGQSPLSPEQISSTSQNPNSIMPTAPVQGEGEAFRGIRQGAEAQSGILGNLGNAPKL